MQPKIITDRADFKDATGLAFIGDDGFRCGVSIDDDSSNHVIARKLHAFARAIGLGLSGLIKSHFDGSSVSLTDDQLKWYLLRLIGDAIDEESIYVGNSFVEMDEAVIHYAGDAGDRYFKVTLTEVDESTYRDPIPGGPIGDPI